MSKEAMKLALEALETEADIYRDNDPIDGEPDHIWEAIKSLRQAIAEAEKQEPVAWMVELSDGNQFVYDKRMLKYLDPDVHATCKPLYTHPQPKAEQTSCYCPNCEALSKKLAEQKPKREWVGLTDKERDDALFPYDRDSSYEDIAKAIEAKLKEKNW